MITWTLALATGIPEIDAQHRELFARVNALEDALHEGDLHASLDTLEFLHRYVLEHFGAEERMMRERAYPKLEAHRRMHADFVATLTRHEKDFEASRSLVALMLHLTDWLGPWLTDHVAVVDREFGNFLQGADGSGHP